MRKTIFLILISISALFAYKFFSNSSFSEIEVNGKKFQVEIADTNEERMRGLSNRESLDKESGMLFVFNGPGLHSFWMKDMSFALDFVWIRSGEVVEITRNVFPADYQPPNVLSSKEKVDMILEINAGEAERFGLEVGDGTKLEL